MIKAGWKLEFRVHGLALSKPEIIVKAALAKPKEAPDLAVTLGFSSELKYPIGIIALPRYVPAGEQQLPLTSYQPSLVKDYTAPGCFLSVTASSQFDLPNSVQEAFIAKPKENARTLPPILEATLRERIRSSAILAAGVYAVSLPDAVFELRAEQQLYWHSDTGSEGFADSTQTAESVGTTSLELPRIKEILKTTDAGLREKEPLGKQLQRAAYHFIRGRQEHPGTVIRFLEMFLVLETLAATVEPQQSQEHRENSEALLSLVKGHSPKLVGFVKNLISRPPSLNRRFAALASAVGDHESETDMRLFRDINRMRGEYVHARSDEPTEINEQVLFGQTDRLATKYLVRRFKDIEARAVAEGKVIEP